MKNLIYKELKLSMHPVCYVFMLVFPIMILIPNYPLFVAFIYVCSSYPVLFLGANKGQQSNDLLYTALLPVRKKDIVKARMFSTTLMVVVSSILLLALSPIGLKIHEAMLEANPEAFKDVEWLGFGIPSIFSCFGLVYIIFGIYNYIFYTLHYKTGKIIVLPTIISMIVFVLLCTIFTLVLPMTVEAYYNFFLNNIVQAITFILGILIYGLLAYITYKKSSKLLEKVDL